MTDPAPESELLDLARALRAQLERLADAGADGLPKAARQPAPAEDARGRAAHVDPSPARAAPPRSASPPTRSVPPQSSTADDSSRSASAPPVPAARAPSDATAGPAGAGPDPATVLDADECARRLHVLAEQVKGCTRCVLHETRTQTVFARGTGTSGLCFVGEGPGADEDAQGYPFVGAAGQLLDRMIAAMGLGRDEVYVCNIVKCRPPKNRKPETDEMAACRPYLVEQLEILAPRVIVALGATAVEGLLGMSGGITRLRGNWRLYRGTVPVMPTFHPAYLLRTPAAKRQVWEDLQLVVKHMGRELPARK